MLSIFLIYYIDSIEQHHHKEDIQVHSLELLKSVRAHVQSTITDQVKQFEGIVASISSNPAMTDEQIMSAIALIKSGDGLIRSVGISREYVVTAVYPLEGNEAAIGLNYLEAPQQLPAIEQAIKTRSNIVVGPVKLVQGGIAEIVRMPIFTAKTHQGKPAGSFWGILSILIDMEQLYSRIQQEGAKYPIQVAISSSVKEINTNTVFFGDFRIFNDPSSIKLEASLPNETWLLAAKSETTPEQLQRHRSLVIGLGLVIAVLITAITFIFCRQFLTQRKIIQFQNTSREQIWHEATHDRLTGMANRHFFQEELKRLVAVAAREHQRLAVFFLDLDRFKDINDSFGHGTGDIFLKHFSNRLKNEVRTSELVARLGGDEFAIVATNISIEQTADLAQRIVDSLDRPIEFDHHSLHGGVSVGISIFPDDGQSPETLTHHADLAMYAAKENPLSSFSFFEAAMNQVAIERKELIANLREGITHQHFHMAYQPIINIQTGNCCGVEALVRWEHPTEGNIPPLSFIPAAESSGLILPLGEWIMATAITETRHLLAKVQPSTLSINLSPIQLYRGEPIVLIQRLLAESSLSPKQLDIEITESTILEDVDTATDIIHQIRGLGVSVTIDDFGTGYSSLSHLQQLPVSRIKVDASFVRRIGEDHNSESIIKAILFLSDLMDVRVTAEGVETEQQLGFLKSLGCEEIQGYYFAKPMNAEHLKAFCESKG